MSATEFDALRSRVETTAERLATVQTDRHRRNRSLLETLERLERKFAAQEQELAYYRDRVRPLEAATAQLCDLTGRLLDMVDAGFEDVDDPEDGVQQAIAVATAMLERDLAPSAPPAPRPDSEADSGPGDGAAELVMEPVAEMETAVDGGAFEDAAVEALAAEAAADQDMGIEGLPEPVRAACSAAAVGHPDAPPAVRPTPAAAPAVEPAADLAVDPAAEPPEAELVPVDMLAEEIGAEIGAEIGTEIVDASPMQPSAADIRALLERVEAAAVRAGAVQEAPAESPNPESSSPKAQPRSSSGAAA